MMSIETIRAESRKAAVKARAAKKLPMVFELDDLADMKANGDVRALRNIPFIGTYVPKGWTLVQEHFVDSSGFGEEGEAALTIAQFVAALDVGKGYAITRAGQFQVYIGEYTPPQRRKGET